MHKPYWIKLYTCRSYLLLLWWAWLFRIVLMTIKTTPSTPECEVNGTECYDSWAWVIYLFMNFSESSRLCRLAQKYSTQISTEILNPKLSNQSVEVWALLSLTQIVAVIITRLGGGGWSCHDAVNRTVTLLEGRTKVSEAKELLTKTINSQL